jgi:hypothetical protein
MTRSGVFGTALVIGCALLLSAAYKGTSAPPTNSFITPRASARGTEGFVGERLPYAWGVLSEASAERRRGACPPSGSAAPEINVLVRNSWCGTSGGPVTEIENGQSTQSLASSEFKIQLVDARMDAKHCYDIRLGCMHSARGDEPRRRRCQSDFNACMRVAGKFSCDRDHSRECGIEREYCVSNARNDDHRLRHCEEDFGACVRSAGCR